MASKLSTLFSIAVLFVLLFFCPSLAAVPTSATPSPETIRSSTTYPDFCKTELPYNRSATVYDYCRFSIHKSLLSAQNSLSIVNQYLGSQSAALSKTAILALEDCQLLAELNIDFLSTTAEAIGSTNTLTSSKAEDIQTWLSAILTNHQTCLDGLQASAVSNTLLTSLSNGTKHYSVSLAIFTNTWVHQTIRGRLLTESKFIFSGLGGGLNGHLPLKLSNQNQRVFEPLSGRKLLQSGTGSVVVSKIVVVDPSGRGNFTTINGAIAAAPNNTGTKNGYFLIHVVAGVYAEYVSIPTNKQNLMLVGDGINRTVITGNRNVADGWTTFNSATLAVVGQGFVAVNITIRNTAGAIKGQAVAVRNGADLSAFYSCSFEGYQDTLYTFSLRQFYRDCDIYGTVDFIFGNAAVVFQNCNIYPRLPLHGQADTITAQGRTDPNQNTGTSIHNCSIRAAADLASSNGTTQTYLGRPWKTYSRTVYMRSFMDSLINPAGWLEWSGNTSLSTLYYAEYNNSGPGSKTTNRVTWPGFHLINATEAAQFTVSNFISGDNWLPATGVPYNGGLL